MWNKIKSFLSVGWLAIAGVFWRMGGSGNYSRYWRRAGVAVLITVDTALKIQTWYYSLIAGLLMFGATSLGYGLPSPDDDKPSALGTFWNKFIKKEFWLRFAVRATVGFLYGLCYWVEGIANGDILHTAIAHLAITLFVPILCSFRLKTVIEESLIGASILLCKQLILLP